MDGQKFEGLKLAEPKTASTVTSLYSTAKSVNGGGQRYFWIGIDDLRNNDGVFRFRSTGKFIDTKYSILHN